LAAYVYVEKAGLWRDIKFNPVPIEEYFHIIDEIGRFVLHKSHCHLRLYIYHK